MSASDAILPAWLAYDAASPMLFNSGLFFALFAAFYAAYLALRRSQGPRLAWTLAFSCFFYWKSSGAFLFLLLAALVLDYLLGHLIHRERLPWRRRFWLLLSLSANLGILFWYKYANFFLGGLSGALGRPFQPMDILLPAGVSFFTFQSLSYTLDIYRREIEPAPSLLDYAFFATFFPQLVAGPIVRAKVFLPQVRRPFGLSDAALSRAWLLLLAGLFKKAVLSDYLSLNFVDRVFDNPGLYTSFENLAAAYAYALQIYCDFSGYSDMAIGLALLMGFELPVNFDSPYRAASLTEFWRRWHISLSSWLRDYLYIPLGGSRLGRLRTYLNLMITMLLGGLWHGASWRFVAWGGLHGVGLALERALGVRADRPGAGGAAFLRRVLTFHLVLLGWIYFRSSDLPAAGAMLRRIAAGPEWRHAAEVVAAYPAVFSLIVLGYLLHFAPADAERRWAARVAAWPWWMKGLALAVLAWFVAQVRSSEVQPFIYFQF